MTQSIEANLFAALDIVVMELLDDGYFKMVSTIPDWFIKFYPEALDLQKLEPGTKFIFLENFIIDARNFWTSNSSQKLTSSLWIEVDNSGKEYHFEASVFRLKTKKILLVALVEEAYQEKQLLLQKCRENNLSYQNLVKEVQKKEILIHCIIHDLAGQLTAIKCCFDLLSFQNLTTKGIEYLQTGKKQATKQQTLIKDVLNAFSAEVESLEAFTIDSQQAPDVLACAKDVIEALSPSFSTNQINLELESTIDTSKDWKVVGEKSRLDRVLTNLVENAFRHSPPNSTITINLQPQANYIVLSVMDRGAGVSPEMANNLFKKFSQGKNKVGKVGLGLYFCRITVERWGGKIGYSPRPNGGSQFWAQLLKPSYDDIS